MESLYRGHRFPPEIISHAVWLYHRFTLSFRDVEDLLAERGILVSQFTVPFRTCSESVVIILKPFIIDSSEPGLFPIGER